MFIFHTKIYTLALVLTTNFWNCAFSSCFFFHLLFSFQLFVCQILSSFIKLNGKKEVKCTWHQKGIHLITYRSSDRILMFAVEMPVALPVPLHSLKSQQGNRQVWGWSVCPAEEALWKSLLLPIDSRRSQGDGLSCLHNNYGSCSIAVSIKTYGVLHSCQGTLPSGTQKSAHSLHVLSSLI